MNDNQKSFWNTFHRKSHNVNDWMAKVLSEVGLFSEKGEFLSEKDHHYLHFQPQVKVSHNIRINIIWIQLFTCRSRPASLHNPCFDWIDNKYTPPLASGVSVNIDID